MSKVSKTGKSPFIEERPPSPNSKAGHKPAFLILKKYSIEMSGFPYAIQFPGLTSLCCQHSFTKKNMAYNEKECQDEDCDKICRLLEESNRIHKVRMAQWDLATDIQSLKMEIEKSHHKLETQMRDLEAQIRHDRQRFKEALTAIYYRTIPTKKEADKLTQGSKFGKASPSNEPQ